ncbi:MAG TPA: hypothetical protein VEJ18_00945 [Planctomycetota bacterium]|nr:hypothetical protein [Planctomycetota bacterium]
MPFAQAFNPSGPVAMPGAVYANLGAKIVPVHHSGPGNLSDAPAWFDEEGRTGINDALSLVRSGRGDIIQLLPGHAQNIAAADALSNLGTKTGVTILGPFVGPPAVLTWTAATSTLLMDAADFVIDGGPNKNIILNMDPGTGTVNVAAPITISAARCKIRNCRIRMGTDANSKVTIGVTTTAAADDLEIAGNIVYGATAAEATTLFQFVGADRLHFLDNEVVGATSAANVGVIRFLTTASTDIKMFRNVLRNNKAASSVVVTGLASNSGEVDQLFMTCLNNNAADLTGAWATVADITFGRQCYVANTIGERAALFGTESA